MSEKSNVLMPLRWRRPDVSALAALCAGVSGAIVVAAAWIDLQFDAPPVTAADLARCRRRTKAPRKRRLRAGDAGEAWRRTQTTLERIATPVEAAQAMALSARAYHRTLRAVRAIADLEGGGVVRRVQVAEALSFRRLWANVVQNAATAVRRRTRVNG